MKIARMDGRAEGEIIGRIHVYEELLKRQDTPTEQLLSLSLDELKRMADELQKEVSQRN